MPATALETFTADGTDLLLVAVDRTGDDARVPPAVRAVWQQLAPWARHARHLAYVRDLPAQSIDGTWPGGFCHDPQELMIALPSWAVDDADLVSTLAHEAHHMVRWGHRGVAETLGATLVSEGFACRFEEQFGPTPPWATQQVTTDAVDHLLAREWDAREWDYAGIFFDGPLGRWLGYTVGYRLATLSGATLEASLTEDLANRFRDLLVEQRSAVVGTHAQWQARRS